MTQEQYQKCRENGLFEPMWLDLLNASGFAGVLPNGNLVDRRYFPEAIPVQKNSMFGVAQPEEIIKKGCPECQSTNIVTWEPGHHQCRDCKTEFGN